MVYYEAGPIESLPTTTMKKDMHLGYDGGCVSQINFPPSTSTFAGSGKSNNFIAYFEGQLKFPSAGMWTMFLKSQDGSKLYIDDQEVVNNDGVHKTMKQKRGTVEIAESSLIKTFRVEYFKGNKGPNGLILKWKGPGKRKSVVQPTDFYTPSEFIILGLPTTRIEIKNVSVVCSTIYYQLVNPLLIWQSQQHLYNFFFSSICVIQAATTRCPTESRNALPSSFDSTNCVTEPDYEYSWPTEDCTLAQNQAVVVDGHVQFPSKGNYTITEMSDDVAKVYLDDKLVLSVDGTPGFQDKGQFSVTISEAGTIKYLRIEFLELCFGDGLDLTWEGPGIPELVTQVVFDAAV